MITGGEVTSGVEVELANVVVVSTPTRESALVVVEVGVVVVQLLQLQV